MRTRFLGGTNKLPIIKKGAEANLILEDFSDLFYPHEEIEKVLVKHRISKDYRAKKLDENLRDFRTLHEAKLLSDAKEAGVPTPAIYRVDRVSMKIVMEYIKGVAIKEVLGDLNSSERKNLCKNIGMQIGLLHDYGIIHGDLTTSNMIQDGKGNIYFIDFGLGEYNSSTEARGTDIHLLHRTLRSTHFRVADESYDAILTGYRKIIGKEAEEVIKRVQEIEKRGRYVKKDERQQK